MPNEALVPLHDLFRRLRPAEVLGHDGVTQGALKEWQVSF
jgi:hypothetical protein